MSLTMVAASSSDVQSSTSSVSFNCSSVIVGDLLVVSLGAVVCGLLMDKKRRK